VTETDETPKTRRTDILYKKFSAKKEHGTKIAINIFMRQNECYNLHKGKEGTAIAHIK
jgi:hypothetical protein